MSIVEYPAHFDTQVANSKVLLLAEREQLKDLFAQRPNARDYLRKHTQIVDKLIQNLWAQSAMPNTLCLIGVGGYGRSELFPASDVDILILCTDENLLIAESIERIISRMWDCGIDLGHSVRTITQSLEQSAADITIQTSMVDARFICGQKSLYQKFSDSFRNSLVVESFFQAKQLEQQQRYSRHNETPYSLEPNCKDSPGGLRDLQVIRWIALVAGFGSHWQALAKSGLIQNNEARELARAENFLNVTRVHLHLLAGRHEDRLLFELQELLANSFHIQATDAGRASERYMQQYYRCAKRVTQLNTLILQNIAAQLDKRTQKSPININQNFQIKRELLDIRNTELFQCEPENILEAFAIMQRRPDLKGMTAQTMRALWNARKIINSSFRRNPKFRAIFLSIFKSKRGIVHELRRMNQYDILGHYLPAFGRIVGRMQHDLFHVYTVDQHTLQVIRNLRRLTMPEFAHEHQFCSQLSAAFERYWVLYIAALFHDIAKGRGGDHSKLGMTDARRFCHNHLIDEEDGELIVFLVEHHLSMSQVAQKQDLADPGIIANFAKLVANERRLVALYLLTVCDIRGTSPKVWNAWRAKLLEDLFYSTQRVMAGIHTGTIAGIQERKEEAQRMLKHLGFRPGIENDLWQKLDTVYFLRHEAEEIAWHTRLLYQNRFSSLPLLVRARLSPIGEGLQVMVYAADQTMLFARLCGYFARAGFNIAEAKIHTTRDGHALDSFVLLDSIQGSPYRDVLALIEHELQSLLATDADLSPYITRLPRQVLHVYLQPEVSIQEDERGQYSLLSITAADRPGLVYAIAKVLADYSIRIHSAKISTLGARVEDTFLISGEAIKHTASLVRLEQALLTVLRLTVNHSHS